MRHPPLQVDLKVVQCCFPVANRRRTFFAEVAQRQVLHLAEVVRGFVIPMAMVHVDVSV